MPIIIKDKEYVSGSFLGLNQLTYYKANTGDRHSFSFRVESNIRISSVGNPILFDLTTNQLTSTSNSWLAEGFRDGDSITLTKYDSGGSVLITWNATINWVNDSVLDVSIMQTAGYDIGAGEIFEVVVTSRGRDDLDLLMNHVVNGQTGSPASLIDGEITRATFIGLEPLAIGGFQAGNLVGNQSGNYIISAGIVRESDVTTGTRQYRITIDYIVQGIHDVTPFQLGGCLKFYVKLEWASIGGEPYERATAVISDDADTGWFNEPYNTGLIDSELIQGVDEISYCDPTTFDIIVDGDPAILGIGCGVAILDDSTYKNLPNNAQTNAIMSSTVDINAITTFYAFGANGEQLQIDINSINTVGTQHTINVTLTPNAQFETFMTNRDDGDRLFYLWVRCGSINHLAYNNQMVCAPPVGGALIMESNARFLDHSQNVETFAGDLTQREHNIEDDVSFYGTFKVDKGADLDGFNVIVEAYNAGTGDDFTLQQANFNFNNVQISNDGRYLLNESQTILASLPNNSLKRQALLTLDASLDTPTEYGVSIYYPFLLRWEYWLDQQNANVDFYPNQNKNWFPYDSTGNWGVRLRLQLIKDGLSFEHTEDITILDYDNTELIDTEIDLFIDSTGQNVPIIVENGLMRVTGTHTLTNGSWFDTSNVWGMITVEPDESAPRWICSSVLPFDGNVTNPLTPLDGVQMVITFPTPNVAKMECYFDPSKINTANGCKFTSKIKGCINDAEINKTMTDGTQKTTTTGDNKTLAI
jgi:hypothetical protein